MSLRIHRIFAVLMLVVIGGLSFYMHSGTDAETTIANPLAEAEKRVSTEKYYEAILALEPLLISDEKSKAQEEALWLAHTLLVKWENLITRSDTWDKDINAKIATLNELGANFANIEINFGYRYGFLQRLIAAYPNSPKQPIAEYALIQSGYPTPLHRDKPLSALHGYIEKYKETGRAEVYLAYLDIAHIHHGFWAACTFPDHDEVAMFVEGGSEDPEKDKKLAASHKEKALKYYAKFYLNPYGLQDKFDYAFYGFKDETGYELLKKNAIFGWQFIFWGC